MTGLTGRRLWTIAALVSMGLGACSATNDSPAPSGDDGSCDPCIDGGDGSVGDAGTPDGRAMDGSGDAAMRDAADGGPGADDASDGAPDAEDASPDAPDATSGDSGPLTSLCATPGCGAGERSCHGLCVANTDPAHGCGAASCASCYVEHATPACTAQGCGYAACEPGWGDCDGNAANGCEADLSTPATCGACGTTCSGSTSVCTPTGCAASCGAPLTDCSGSCVNLSTDPYHCGACSDGFSTCTIQSGGGFPTCAGGTCGTACFSGMTACNGNCVDLTRDALNCGACGHDCPTVGNSLSTCAASACTAVCEPGWTVCGAACTTTYTDNANCGACGHACGTSDTCIAGACTPLASLWLATTATVDTLALDATHVYWTDGVASVFSVPVGGGSVTTLAMGQAKPTGLAVDATHVYWSNTLGAAIMSAPKNGTGTPQMIAPATEPEQLAVYGGNVYWLDQSLNVWTVPTSGGTPTVAITTISNGNVALIGGTSGVFALNYGSPFAINSDVYGVTAGWRSTVVGGPGAFALATDGTSLFSVSTTIEPVFQWNDVTTGAATGGAEVAGDRVVPLAANGCGLFYAGSSGSNSFVSVLLHPETYAPAYTPTLLSMQVPTAVADAGFLYFYSPVNQAVGKLPMP